VYPHEELEDQPIAFLKAMKSQSLSIAGQADPA
jgi:hypothetical protein